MLYRLLDRDVLQLDLLAKHDRVGFVVAVDALLPLGRAEHTGIEARLPREHVVVGLLAHVRAAPAFRENHEALPGQLLREPVQVGAAVVFRLLLAGAVERPGRRRFLFPQAA